MEKGQKPDTTADVSFSFEGTDYKGRIVSLPAGRWEWKILARHPDLAGYEEAVKSTALDPDVVLQEYDVKHVEIHGTRDLGTGLYSGKILWVPIRFKGERALVITAHWLRKIKPRQYESIVWRRK